MIDWICLICIVICVAKIMCFFSVSALSELYDEKPAKKKKRRKSSYAPRRYAATGTYGRIDKADYIKKRSM